MQIFENADFISCEERNRSFRFLVEEGGRILFTGDLPPDPCHSVRTRRDLQGRCVLPAFVDTHMHFESFALFRATLDVRHVRNFPELSRAIRQFEAEDHRSRVILRMSRRSERRPISASGPFGK